MSRVRIRKRWAQASACACLLVLAAQAPTLAQKQTASRGAEAHAADTAAPIEPAQKSLLIQMQDAFINIAKTVEPTVVNIKAVRGADSGSYSTPSSPPSQPKTPKKGAPQNSPAIPSLPERSEATGSGVIVRADGYILTNDHVVEQASGGNVTVTLSDGRQFTGKVYPDYKSDLAIVKIDPGATPLPVAKFADSSSVRSGQWAIAVGSPFDLQNTVTVGIISAVGRHQLIPGETGEGGRYYPDLIQTDAAINPGNSGGPLFNIDGEVVGINVAIESPVEGSAGIGFAIPITIAQSVVTALIDKGKVVRGFLGLQPDDLTPAAQAEYGQKEGAFVRDVGMDSPAGKAGLHAGDIITQFGGTPITNEITLREAIAATAPGKEVKITLVRNGKPLTVTATIAAPQASPGDAAPTPTPPVDSQYKIGLGVRDLTAQERQQFTLADDAPGVFVASVAPGSAAEYANLAEGMVLQQINGTDIHNPEEFKKAVGDIKGADVTMIVLFTDPADNQIHQHALTFRL